MRAALDGEQWLKQGERPQQPRRRSVQCASPAGLHRIAYLEWGDPRNRDVLVCVHGLTRSGARFRRVGARALRRNFAWSAPTSPGAATPTAWPTRCSTSVPQYVADMVTLIARLDVESVNWVGTSLGGLVGMALAAQAGTPGEEADPERRRAGHRQVVARAHRRLRRQGAGVRRPGRRPSKYVRTISAPFGPHSDAQWRFAHGELGAKERRRQLAAALRSAHRRSLSAPPCRTRISSSGTLYDAVRCPDAA